MDLKEYTPLALETALPTAFSTKYLLPAIYGEFGEVIEKFGKAYRDGRSIAWLDKETAKEYGDICWPLAILLHLAGSDQDSTYFTDRFQPAETPEEALRIMSFPIQHLLKTYWGVTPTDGPISHHLRTDAEDLWAFLREHCYMVTGHTFSQVLQMNVDKLADRKARGVLGGSGDNR